MWWYSIFKLNLCLIVALMSGILLHSTIITQHETLRDMNPWPALMWILGSDFDHLIQEPFDEGMPNFLWHSMSHLLRLFWEPSFGWPVLRLVEPLTSRFFSICLLNLSTCRHLNLKLCMHLALSHYLAFSC